MTAIPRLSIDGTTLDLHYGGTRLLRYVFEPSDAPLESPRPYLHPVRTLSGDEISLYRPHDHVWHKGLSLSLPHVGAANFWGGVTWVRGEGYRQLPNNGSMRHVRFDSATVGPDGVAMVDERLLWVTQQGQEWIAEHRVMRVRVEEPHDAWVLDFTTTVTNVAGRHLSFGSPSTHGRTNAGYGGLFWRGPRSFTGGTVHGPFGSGGDELMGVRAEWMAFTGVHDGHGRYSTIVMVDAPDNPTHPTQWFVRAHPFACLCPAPFFETERVCAPGEGLTLRYAVVIGDGDGSRAPLWARLGAAAWAS